MNATFDGQYFICPDGTEEFQDGYRDAMFHHARHGQFFVTFDDYAGDYAEGYRQAIRDVLDHFDELGRDDTSWRLVQRDSATYVSQLEGKTVAFIRYNGQGRGSWQVTTYSAGTNKFHTPEQAHEFIRTTFR